MATKFIAISVEILQDKKLNANQKFLLAEIEQLSQLDKGCIASNQHFSDLIGITKENVSKNISKLEEMGYIKTEIVPGTRNHTRIITLIKSTRPPYQIDKTPLSNRQETKGIEQVNKTNIYASFLTELKSSCKYKSKVTSTKDGEKLFKQIEDKEQLAKDYLHHQETKGEFAVRITKFMEDYNTVYKSNNSSSYTF